jgi:hypothetical protein
MDGQDFYYEKRTIKSTNNVISSEPLNTVFRQSIQPLRGVRTMGVDSVSIPHTWYNISERLENNILLVDGTETPLPDANLSVQLDYGAPLFNSRPIIENYINTQLDLLYPATWNVRLGNDYKLIFSVTASSFTNETLQATERLGRLLGLDPDKVYDLATDLPFTADHVIDLQPIKSVFVRVMNSGTGVYSDGVANAATYDIPVGDTVYGEFINYESRTGHINLIPFSKQGTNIMISEISIGLVDDRGAYLDLNGADWSIVLGFRISPSERPMPMHLEKYFVD